MYAWNPDSEECAEDLLVLLKIKGKIVSHTLIQDYIFQPVEYSQVSLYDWICLSHIEKCSKEIEQNSSQDVDETESDDENDVQWWQKKMSTCVFAIYWANLHQMTSFKL